MDVLSTRDLAAALGVSESSIKRWADDGLLRAARTAGGHRRIARADAIRFVRETRATVVRPQLLGLAEAGVASADARWRRRRAPVPLSVSDGAAAHARGLLLQLYLAGASVAAILDGPVRRRSRASARCGSTRPTASSASTGRPGLPAGDPPAPAAALHRRGAPVALGGAAAGDPYLLPSLGAATVLASEGFEAVNLGADTPADAFERAAERLAPRLVWVSVSIARQPERTAREIAALARALAARGAHLAVGGRAAAALRLPALPNLQTGSSMAELAAFARGLAHAVPTPA